MTDKKKSKAMTASDLMGVLEFMGTLNLNADMENRIRKGVASMREHLPQGEKAKFDEMARKTSERVSSGEAVENYIAKQK